ncbi:MAG TPA: ABC transporter substrate-binding protein [Solirubrobacteraceae bacterium]|nr:ABC transporter substrate-binding protein [Solirubrobacteraceae bacterium]
MNRTRSKRCGRLRIAITAAILAVAFAVAVAGCGSGSGAARAGGVRAAAGALPRLTRATLVLDFVPNAVHAGIYRALAAGYYRAENISLRVIPPSSTSSTLSLIAAGRASFGLADGSDVATQIARGQNAEAVMAIAQSPLGGLIALASERLRSPASLVGRTVGITGVPSDTAVLDTVVASAGGDPARVHVVNVGFNGAQDLAAGRIAAFTGFWPADGVQLAVSGHPITVFKLDSHGGPAYPGLVAFTTQALAASDPALVRAFVAATVHGYNDVLRHPVLGLHDLLALNPGLDRRFTNASLRAYLPLFDDGGRVRFGQLQPAHVAALSRWMVAHKLISRPIPVARYGTNAFLPSG